MRLKCRPCPTVGVRAILATERLACEKKNGDGPSKVIHEFQSDELQRHAAYQQRAARVARNLIVAGRWAGWVTFAGGCIVLTAYMLGVEAIWRPIAAGPATSPRTAFLFVAGGLAVAAMRPMRTPLAPMVLLLVVGVTAFFRILEVAAGTSGVSAVPLFEETLAREAAEQNAVSFGWNSAAVFVLVAAAFLLRSLGQAKSSQLVAAVGMAPPLVALVGYIYGLDEFYGDMSLTTAVLALPFSAAPLLFGARTGIVRAISSPWDGGKFGRLEIVLISSVILLGGFALHISHGEFDSNLIPFFVVMAILVTSTTIAYCTVVIEKGDHERRRAERMVSQLVMHDPLTGLYNRRFLNEQKERVLSFANRRGYQIGVAMLDIDHFKSVNDEFGHPAGDKVIRRIAKALRKRLRGSDIPVRYGGEEMLVVLLDVDLDGAVGAAEDLRQSIATLDFPELDLRPITVSVGVAQVLNSLTEAIGRADVALYVAKKSGRNRVVGDEMQPGPELVDLKAVANPSVGAGVRHTA